MAAEQNEAPGRRGARPVAPALTELEPEDLELVTDIAAGIDRRLASLVSRRSPSPTNVSFVIDCRKRLKERKWEKSRQRRVCAALERRSIEAGWKHASIYVMEHDHLRLRVTLRAQATPRQ